MEDISKTKECIILNKNITVQPHNQTSKLKHATLLHLNFKNQINSHIAAQLLFDSSP